MKLGVFVGALLLCVFASAQEDAVFVVDREISIPGEQVLFLAKDDRLIFIEKDIDEAGTTWLRFGRESSSLLDQAEMTDFWIEEKVFASLNLREEILARMTYCYRYVKKYLLRKGFVDVYLPGASAYMAADILPKHGFLKAKRTPPQAIHYDVCVYKGGPSGHGHIEVLDPKGWYYGYGYKTQPIKNRTFLGCFYKAP